LSWQILRELKREAARVRYGRARYEDVARLLMRRGNPIGERSLKRHVADDLGLNWNDI
jgi:hypothetical protein